LNVKSYSVEVTADAAGLERYLKAVLPGQEVTVSATGNTVTLSGQVQDASAAARAVEIAKGSGALVVDNLSIPTAVQVLLQVRFAEVTRSALEDYSSALSTVNPQRLSDNGDWQGSTSSDGNVTFSLLNLNSSLDAVLRALRSRGDFKSLAEPNLLTLPGKEASFLAGGEFPYPTVQSGAGGATGNAVTIVFKEFGIRLRFTPTIMRNGNIRLMVAPEVSSLDFANALTFQGFVVPSLLTRRAETEVELQNGQHLSIAGLLDNSLIKNVTKIPILGDIPILGQLFRSKSVRERRTELLVIVTPRLVGARDTMPPIPTGEVRTWGMPKGLRMQTDSAGIIKTWW
jgi:pilus assembly protein CpaC